MNKVRDCDPTAAGNAESLHWLSSTLDEDPRHLRTDASASLNLFENMLSPRRRFIWAGRTQGKPLPVNKLRGHGRYEAE